MNWYEKARREASSTNYSNLLNSAFGNSSGDLDQDEAIDEVVNPDGSKGTKKTRKSPDGAVCYYCSRPK